MNLITIENARKLYGKTRTTIKLWLGNWEQNNLGVKDVFEYSNDGAVLINKEQLDKWLVKYRNKEDLK